MALALLLALALATARPGDRDRTDALLGDWGGQGASLVVGQMDSDVQLGCRTGTIIGPYSVSRAGTFRWVGTIGAKGRGKPINALFVGRLDGNVAMTLRLRLTDGRVLGPYRLERFRKARLPAC